MTLKSFARKSRKAIKNARYLFQSRFRVCECCNRFSFIISFSEGEEAKLCMRCRANFRYELLARHLRKEARDLSRLTVLELDPNSALRPLLTQSGEYIRTYYSPTDRKGTLKPDGERCEDITQLTFPDESLDVIVSSDVLEHVPDIQAAFRETYRVLKPGGYHLFTVPPREKTRKRAEIVQGEVRFLTEPDYHSDPLDPKGILAFWDFGPDAVSLFNGSGLSTSVVEGPEGKDRRIVWKAVKPQSA
jgi:SAM-dependent methyltransferase